MILERLAEIDFEMDELRIEYESLQDELHEINESEKEAEDRAWRGMKMRRRGEMEVGILFVAGLIFAYIASYSREEMERDSEWWSSRNERRK